MAPVKAISQIFRPDPKTPCRPDPKTPCCADAGRSEPSPKEALGALKNRRRIIKRANNGMPAGIGRLRKNIGRLGMLSSSDVARASSSSLLREDTQLDQFQKITPNRIVSNREPLSTPATCHVTILQSLGNNCFLPLVHLLLDGGRNERSFNLCRRS